MSSYTQNPRLRDIAKNSLKKKFRKNAPIPPSVNLQYSRDGKSIEVAIDYYFSLSNKDAAVLESSADAKPALAEIIDRKMASISNKSKQAVVSVDLGDNNKVEILIDRTKFKRITYDPRQRIIKCTTSFTNISAPESISPQIQKTKGHPLVSRLDEEPSPPLSVRAENKYSAEIKTTILSQGTKVVESRKVTIPTPPSIKLDAPHILDKTTQEIPVGDSIVFPLISDLYLEQNTVDTCGYFSLNKSRLFLDKDLNSSEVSEEYTIELFRTQSTPKVNSQKIETLQRVDFLNNTPGVQFYKFEHPRVPGENQYHLKISKESPSMKEAKKVVQEVNEISSILSSNVSDFHKGEGNIKRLEKLYDKVQKVTGKRDSTLNRTQSLEETYRKSNNPGHLTHEIYEYLNNRVRDVERHYSIYKTPSGSLGTKNKLTMEEEYLLKPASYSNYSEENLFEKSHTISQVQKVVSQYSSEIKEIPFKISYDTSSSNFSTAEDEGYFLDKSLTTITALGMTKDYEVKVYLLKGYDTSYKHAVPLLKRPRWVTFAPKEVDRPTFARAEILCSDGTRYEEYFVIGE